MVPKLTDEEIDDLVGDSDWNRREVQQLYKKLYRQDVEATGYNETNVKPLCIRDVRRRIQASKDIVCPLDW